MSNSTPPTSEIMVRNDDETSTTTNNNIQIVQLTSEHFREAHWMEINFNTDRKGCCFGLLKFAWCPASQSEFDSVYKNDLSRRETYGVAILPSSSDSISSYNKVVGICKGRRYGQTNMTWDERLLHKPKLGEFYIDTLVVKPQFRNKGVGTRLLEWAQQKAKNEFVDTHLALGVMEGNPAIRLYTRFGFEETYRSGCCCVGCLIGRPHGSFVGIYMVKEI